MSGTSPTASPPSTRRARRSAGGREKFHSFAHGAAELVAREAVAVVERLAPFAEEATVDGVGGQGRRPGNCDEYRQR